MTSTDLAKREEEVKSTAASKFLETAVKRYQFDVVGWTEYCLDNTMVREKMLPVYRQKPYENLRIQDKLVTAYGMPPLKKVYDSRENYTAWLDEEYGRDQAFYEAILKNPDKIMLSLGLGSERDQKDRELNEEIDRSAAEYLQVIEGKKVDEAVIIENIDKDIWLDIKTSEHPKVQLGVELGAAPEPIVNNFAVYFMNQLKGHFAGSKTAFLTSTGPASWNEMEKCRIEMDYFRKQILGPSIKKLE